MRKLSHTIGIYFEDIGQSFFLRNGYFGATLLALFCVFDPYAFFCGLVASLIAFFYTLGNSTPRVLKDSGLVTLNGFFFGIAMASLFERSPSAFLLLILGSITIPFATKAVFEVVQHWKISPYIVPYGLSIWLVWLCSASLSLGHRQDIWPEVIATLPPLHPGWPLWRATLDAVAQSTGRLLFLPRFDFGIAVLALLALFSPRRGFFFLVGTVIATFIALLFTAGSAWQYGFFSFCGGLVGLGLAASPEKLNARTIVFFCVISSFITIASDQFLRELKLPLLSLPYVLTMWFAALSRIPRVNMSWRAAAKTREEQVGAA